MTQAAAIEVIEFRASDQDFTFTYDVLSRPTSRTEPDLTTTWTWGSSAASYNIGKLQSVTARKHAGDLLGGVWLR